MIHTEEAIAEIYTRFTECNLFHKYNEYYGIDLVQSLKLENRFKGFSWGLLYLYIRLLKNNEITDGDLKTAYYLEMFCLSSKILDDILDKDTEWLEIMDDNGLTLLFTELLMEAQAYFSTLPSHLKGLAYLQKSLKAEWLDVHQKATDPQMSEAYYQENILPKTSAIVQFICLLAGSAEDFPWFEFSLAFQLSNDLKGLENTKRSDVPYQRPTLPLILSHQKGSESGLKEYCRFRIEEARMIGRDKLFCNFPSQKELVEAIMGLLPW
ncbi:MAG: class 1 isoprenoid biosynthesis enzyme [Turicibacter sp.]|nr:class 1 isoprenoid biosynthesis enzyme [Turicibacter sp.]